MRTTILKFGLMAGVISSLGFLLVIGKDDMAFDNGMVYGFTSMAIAFALIFVAVKRYRDRQNGGAITFGNAFKIGLFISLIAATVYVVIWLFTLYLFVPDFAETYTSHCIAKMQAEGMPQPELAVKMAEMEEFKESYKNPVIVVLYTYTEILPVGILIALICAAVMKRKPKPAGMA